MPLHTRRRAATSSYDPVGNNSHAGATRLAATLLVGGSAHFIAPKFFDNIIPPILPGRPRIYTYVSGAAALAIGTGLLIAPTRRTAGRLAAVFFVAVMPAKVQMAVAWWRNDQLSMLTKIVGILQLFWQIPLVTEALKVQRTPALSGCGEA